MTALSTRVEGAEVAINAVKATVDRQLAQWEGIVEGAIEPLGLQQADTAQHLAAVQHDLSAVYARASDASAAIVALKETVGSELPGQWQADVAGAVEPLRDELAGIQQWQADVDQSMQVG